MRSDPPVDAQAMRAHAGTLGLPVDLVRLDTHTGTTAAKNIAARRAKARYLLSLDDDAFLVRGESVARAVALLDGDDSVAAVAFAQADEHAARRQAQQPAAGDEACYVPAFVGFGCLIRRDRLLDVGGYRDVFVIHGEERELCLRWLDRGMARGLPP